MAVGETGGQGVLGEIMGFEATASFVESTELDGDAGTDPDEGGEGAFIEGEEPFFVVDTFSGYEGVGVLS